MAVVSMSEAELARVGGLGDVAAGRLSVAHAAGLMGVSRRQAFRLLRRVREGGASALASCRRGQPSNRRLPQSVRTLVMAVVRERYADFGPTLAAEKLAALHGLTLSRGALRQRVKGEGPWGRSPGAGGWWRGSGGPCGRGVPSRSTSHAGAVSAWASWCKSTVRGT